LVRAAITCAALAAAGPAAAECRLALALGFDVSNSVSVSDYALQRDGLVAALADPEIRRAILAPGGTVALAVFEWGGRRWQAVVIDWVELGDAATIDALAARIGARYRPEVWQPTAIGAALLHARALYRDAPVCAHRALDMSGDGRNNYGPDPARVYARADFGDLVVNGLAIGGHESDIADYYAREVIRGPGAFVEWAARHEDFPRVFRRKLLRELTGPALGRAAPETRPASGAGDGAG
jgi:hypothetical protein